MWLACPPLSFPFSRILRLWQQYRQSLLSYLQNVLMWVYVGKFDSQGMFDTYLFYLLTGNTSNSIFRLEFPIDSKLFWVALVLICRLFTLKSPWTKVSTSSVFVAMLMKNVALYYDIIWIARFYCSLSYKNEIVQRCSSVWTAYAMLTVLFCCIC